MGKPRLPATGIRKQRAKDKRVGRKRTQYSAGCIPLRPLPASIQSYTVCDGCPGMCAPNECARMVESIAMLVSEPETVFDDPVAERLSLELDEELDRINPATKFGELSRQVTVAVDPDDIPMRAGAASFVGMTPREIREQQTEADAIEDQIRSQAVVDRARAEIDAVPEVQLDDTEPQS